MALGSPPEVEHAAGLEDPQQTVLMGFTGKEGIDSQGARVPQLPRQPGQQVSRCHAAAGRGGCDAADALGIHPNVVEHTESGRHRAGNP
jgi:hypothetical protein